MKAVITERGGRDSVWAIGEKGESGERGERRPQAGQHHERRHHAQRQEEPAEPIEGSLELHTISLGATRATSGAQSGGAKRRTPHQTWACHVIFSGARPSGWRKPPC